MWSHCLPILYMPRREKETACHVSCICRSGRCYNGVWKKAVGTMVFSSRKTSLKCVRRGFGTKFFWGFPSSLVFGTSSNPNWHLIPKYLHPPRVPKKRGLKRPAGRSHWGQLWRGARSHFALKTLFSEWVDFWARRIRFDASWPKRWPVKKAKQVFLLFEKVQVQLTNLSRHGFFGHQGMTTSTNRFQVTGGFREASDACSSKLWVMQHTHFLVSIMNHNCKNIIVSWVHRKARASYHVHTYT